MRVSPILQPDKSTREISQFAVWRVSSSKPGNGVRMLRDGREDTYWQSDGAQPHIVTLEFQKLVTLSGLALYIDYKLDESYTPQKISIRAGTRINDMKEVKSVELIEPHGWVLIPLTHHDTGLPHIKAFVLEVVVVSNHQNGRDTHVRQLRVFGPRTDPLKALGFEVTFTSPEFNRVAFVR
ncbi:hypothetical protein Ndes2526B_g02513 [Nannochloris sp. 'desiccata']|nr:putative Anaphase-promoting complex subunit 10 [Chlorella desiccata (nom. nud.)]